MCVRVIPKPGKCLGGIRCFDSCFMKEKHGRKMHKNKLYHVGLETSIRVFYSLCRGGWADSTASTEQIHDVSASLWPYTWRCLFYVWRSVLLPNFRTYPDCFHRQRSCTVLQVVVLCPYQPNKSCLNLYISAYIHLRFMKDHSTGPCIQLMYDLNTV